MAEFNKSEFNFTELITNEDGKTSGSGFVGLILGLIASIGTLIGITAFILDMPNAIEFLGVLLKIGGLSAILMGVRKGVSGFVQKAKTKYNKNQNVG